VITFTIHDRCNRTIIARDNYTRIRIARILLDIEWRTRALAVCNVAAYCERDLSLSLSLSLSLITGCDLSLIKNSSQDIRRCTESRQGYLLLVTTAIAHSRASTCVRNVRERYAYHARAAKWLRYARRGRICAHTM